MACTYISSTCVCTSVKMCHSSRSIERRKRMKANEWTRTHPCRLLLVLPLRLVVHQKVDEGSAEEGGNHRPHPRKYHRRQTGEEVTKPKHQLAGVVGVADLGVQPRVAPTVRDVSYAAVARLFTFTRLSAFTRPFVSTFHPL